MNPLKVCFEKNILIYDCMLNSYKHMQIKSELNMQQ